MSLPHDSSHLHVSGNSEFVDDRTKLSNELFVEVFYSIHARAKIKKIKLEKALKSPGVVQIYTAQDIHHNLWGTIFKDQPLLADKEVHFAGEPIAIVAAISQEAAMRARLLIEVDYEVMPAILSVSEAKHQKSFIGSHRKIERGEVVDQLHKA